QHDGGQHRDDVPTAAGDRRGGPEWADRDRAGQRAVSAQRGGAGAGEGVGDDAVVPAVVFPEPEPDRAAVEVHQTACALRPVSSDVRRFPSGHRGGARRPFDHPRRATEDVDDAQVPAVRRCLPLGRVRYKLLACLGTALLMTTHPGDLVLDPACGSGTTAYVAEQWGRRWITIDTSRVA